MRLVSSRDHQLRRGDGIHLDCFALALLVAGCSLLALPWPAATTLASLAHVRALARFRPSSLLGRPPLIETVSENRITPLCVSALLGASLQAAALLRRVPIAALDGFWLYLGSTLIFSSQLVERVRLAFLDTPSRDVEMQSSLANRVQLRSIWLYTTLQVACVVSIYTLRYSSPVAAVCFPLMIAALEPIRGLLRRGPLRIPAAELSALEATRGDASPIENFGFQGFDPAVYDLDASGDIDECELRAALDDLGLTELDEPTRRAVRLRFEEASCGGTAMTMEDFAQLVVELRGGGEELRWDPEPG